MTTAASPVQQAQLFDQLYSMGHEQVMMCQDRETGLKAIIAVHNTVLGPALGGTRFWSYNNDHDALTDVLRLSRGMTFKAAISGLHLGGGKAVIIGNPNELKSEALFRRFGKFVENLNGKYITAEDVGVDEADMMHVHAETNHVVGLPEAEGGGGDPSPFTAYGVLLGMKATWKHRTGEDTLQGKRVIVQGVGKVGFYLAKFAAEEGANVLAADINEDNLRRVQEIPNVTVVDNDTAPFQEADIYAPCALGGILNPDTIPELKVKAVAGASNNQLLDEHRDGEDLRKRNIAFGPDFLINAGGLINVYTEIEGYNEDKSRNKIEGIYTKTLDVLKRSDEKAIPAQQAAIELAEERIQAVGSIKRYR